jgi:hypothetical protein
MSATRIAARTSTATRSFPRTGGWIGQASQRAFPRTGGWISAVTTQREFPRTGGWV